MKLTIVFFAAASLAVATAVSGLASGKQAQAVEPACSDTCDLAAHRAVAQSAAHGDMVADDMSAMSGMSGAPSTTPPTAGASNAKGAAAMGSMTDMAMHGGHMTMTSARPQNAADRARAGQIVQALRVAIEPYKDYRVAEAAGYKPFHPEWPLPMYHFTNVQNALANEFSFDAARPTSLMYKRVTGGYELVGAMYTAPRSSTLDQLDARVPLSVATWHEHVNLCIPPLGLGAQAFGPDARFGLAGSITTPEACAQAGGTFKPIIYNWMVHVWPFETDPTKVWATQDNPGTMDH
jgi:hypothetical protein